MWNSLSSKVTELSGKAAVAASELSGKAATAASENLQQARTLLQERDPDAAPSLYEEADEMLQASLLMYAFASIRALAREDKLEGDRDAILNAPVSVGAALRVISENEEALRKCGEDSAQVLDALTSVQKRLDRTNQGGWSKLMSRAKDSTLDIFSDENSLAELVYAIGVDQSRRRVTVAFRGSVTKTDWITDMNMLCKEVPNPVKNEGAHQEANLLIHSGFYEYLFVPSKDSQTGRAKFEEIVDQARRILAQNPGYALYATGHSLGGALSSLFAFEAAASADIPKPVTCVSIASPKVGARSFGRAFKLLERQGKLRHLRVANYQDAVTLAPDMEALSGAYSLLCQDRVFRHVGIELKLYEEDDCRLLYSGKDHGNKVLHVLQKQAMTVASIPSLFMGTDLINNHGCQEYQKRLFRVKEALVTKNLEQLYKDDEICGGIFDKF